MSKQRYDAFKEADNSKDTLTGEFWYKVRQSIDSYDRTMLKPDDIIEKVINVNQIHLANLMAKCFELGQKEAYDYAWIVQQREFNALLHKLEDDECDEGCKITKNWMLNHGMEIND